MIIGIAGPYSADTEDQKQRNLDAMNIAAARLLEMGHLPLIGVNAALPVVTLSNIADKYKAIMEISLTLIDKCDGLFFLGESPGANRERDLILSKGLPVYLDIHEIPAL